MIPLDEADLTKLRADVETFLRDKLPPEAEVVAMCHPDHFDDTLRALGALMSVKSNQWLMRYSVVLVNKTEVDDVLRKTPWSP